MNVKMRAEIVESIDDSFEFLRNEYRYKIIDKESSSSVFFYIRYENKNYQRVISIGIDLRDNKFGIAIWKSPDGETKDENMLDFADYLIRKHAGESLRKMTHLNSAITTIREINKYNAKVLREYGTALIQGEEWL